MLPDQITCSTITNTVPTFAAGTATIFAKIRNGLSMASTGLASLDQPWFLGVRQKARDYRKPLAPAQFELNVERHFNAPPINAIAQPDVPLKVRIIVDSVAALHTDGHVAETMTAAVSLVYANLARLRAGEGL